MSLFDDAIEASGKCLTCQVAEALEAHPDMADDIMRIIAAKKEVSERGAVQAFTKHGIDITRNGLAKHRRNECTVCRRQDRTF